MKKAFNIDEKTGEFYEPGVRMEEGGNLFYSYSTGRSSRFSVPVCEKIRRTGGRDPVFGKEYTGKSSHHKSA